MTAPARVERGYLVLFASLYAVQGVVVAYFFNFNQNYMAAAGVAQGTIGWVQTVALLPFVFKFLAGPLSDRVSPFGLGRRKPYIIFGLALQILGLIGLSLVNPGRSLALFVALAFLTVLGLALFDTCCDGMVIDVTPVTDRPRVQGTLVASRFVTTMVFSWGFGHWLSLAGAGVANVHLLLWTCAGLTVLPLVLAIRAREPVPPAETEAFHWEALAVLIRPRSLVLLAFGAVYSTIAYGVEINLSTYYKSLGFDPGGDVGDFAALRYLGRAVGGALLPLLAPRLGRYGVLTTGVVGLALSTAGQVLVGGKLSAASWGFVFGAANGWDDAMFNVLSMEASDPRMAASTYALFMAVSNLSVTGGGLFSSSVGAWGGRYRPVFLIASLLTLASLSLVPPLKRPSPAREAHDVAAT
jgi:MFS transporter, PAT family, beta-lactamase induction signal transducer AmpG